MMLNNFSCAYWSCGYLAKRCFKSHVHLLKPDGLSLPIGRSLRIYSVFKSLVGLILALVFSWPGAGLFTLPSWVLIKFFNGVARIQKRLESSAHRVPASLVPFQARLWSRGCFFLSFRLPLEEGRDGNSLPFHKGERQRGFQFQFPFPLKYHQGRDDEVERRTQTRLLSTLPSCPQSEPPGSRAPSPAEFQSCGDHWCSLWRRHPRPPPNTVPWPPNLVQSLLLTPASWGWSDVQRPALFGEGAYQRPHLILWGPAVFLANWPKKRFPATRLVCYSNPF